MDKSGDDININWYTWELSLTAETVIGIIALMLAVKIIFLQ